MLNHFRPLFVTNALEPGDIAGLTVDLVEVKARAREAAGVSPAQPPPLQIEDSCRLVSREEGGGIAELLVRASAGERAEAELRFVVTITAGPMAGAQMLEHPRTLGVIATLARPAVLDACRMVMNELVRRRRLERASVGLRGRMRRPRRRRRLAPAPGGEKR